MNSFVSKILACLVMFQGASSMLSKDSPVDKSKVALLAKTRRTMSSPRELGKMSSGGWTHAAHEDSASPRALGSSNDFGIAEDAMEAYFEALEGSRCENGDGEDVAKLFEKDIGTYQDSFVAEEIGGALIGRNDIEEYFDEVACDVATYEFLDGIIEEAECEGDVCSFWGFAMVGVDFNDGGECVFEVAFYGSVFDVDMDDKKKGKRRRLGGSDVEFLNLNFNILDDDCDNR